MAIFKLTDEEKAALDQDMENQRKAGTAKAQEPDLTNWTALMKLVGWIAAITAGAHPQGHVATGNQRGIPMRVDYQNFVEDWNIPDRPAPQFRLNEATGNMDVSWGRPTWRDISDTTAAGFRGGDTLTDLFPQDRSLQIANALYKLFYPTATRAFTGESGDIKSLKEVTGNRAVPAMMGFDALSDLFFDDPNRKITFETRDGTPVLLFKKRF